MANKIKNHKIELNLQILGQNDYLGRKIKYNGKVDKEITNKIGEVGRLYSNLKNTLFGKNT